MLADLLLPVSTIATKLRGLYNVTIFDGPPGKLGPLPDELGGSHGQWFALADAAARGRAPFFGLLAAKADYLMLPKSIIEALNIPEVFVTEMPVEGALATEVAYGSPRLLVELDIPQGSMLLARAGTLFGQTIDREDAGGNFAILPAIYHEMTHGWIDLHDIPNSPIGPIYTQGLIAYASAVDVTGKLLDAYRAFTEAAADYVFDRITRWGNALTDLNNIACAKPSDQGTLQYLVHVAEGGYNRPQSVYGTVDNKAIASPALPQALRDAINTTVLDGLPLTKDFADTPLADVRDALLNP